MRAGKIFIADLKELQMLEKVRASALPQIRMNEPFWKVKTVKIVLWVQERDFFLRQTNSAGPYDV